MNGSNMVRSNPFFALVFLSVQCVKYLDYKTLPLRPVHTERLRLRKQRRKIWNLLISIELFTSRDIKDQRKIPHSLSQYISVNGPKCSIYIKQLQKRMTKHGSHFLRLTNFPDFSSIFCSFPVFFKVHFLFKAWYHICRIFTITGWQISLTFPVFFSIFQYKFF